MAVTAVHNETRTVTIDEAGQKAQPGDKVNLKDVGKGAIVPILIPEKADPGIAATIALEHAVGDEFEIPLPGGTILHRFESIERTIPSGHH